MTLDYVVSGAKNEEEIIWARSVALNIYNIFAEMSEDVWAGFNKAWDYMNENGLRLDISREEVCVDIDPRYEAVANEFMREICRKIAIKNGGVKNNRIIQLRGVDTIEITPDMSKATLFCSVEDYNKD